MNVMDLLDRARAATDLYDLGDDSILEPLRRLVDALNTEAALNQHGRESMEKELLDTLSNRLRVEDHLKRHPELLEKPIEKPLFVFGLPRTGTTLLINLLNTDPARRCLLRWESFDSVPPPRPDELSAGPRYEKAQAISDMGLKYAPHIAAIHHENADSPSECQFAMTPSFVSQYYDSILQIPSYRKWFLYEADYLPAFRYHKRFLQLLQQHTGGRWTLKNPWHPLYLNALTTVYPDAQLVMTHRDPVEVLGSACSLLKAVRPIYSDRVDLDDIAECLMETFDLMIERSREYRKLHGRDAIYDVLYTDVMKDPIGEIRKLYAHFDEPLTAEAEAAMEAYMRDNPKGKHGKHHYAIEDYGLTRQRVRERYRDYCEEFGISIRD